jgi:hypothetical protein
VGGRVQQHALEGQPLLSLLVGLLGDPHARGVEALGQLVARHLQLSQIEHPRLGEPGRGLREPAHRVGGHEGVGQLALQAGDLGPQGAAGRPLGLLGGAFAQQGRTIGTRAI